MVRYLGAIIVVAVCIFASLKVHQWNAHKKVLLALKEGRDIDRIKMSRNAKMKLTDIFLKDEARLQVTMTYPQMLFWVFETLVAKGEMQNISCSDESVEVYISLRGNNRILLRCDGNDIYTVEYIQTTPAFDSLMAERLINVDFFYHIFTVKSYE